MRRISLSALLIFFSVIIHAQSPFKQTYDVVGDLFSKGYHTNTLDGGMMLITKSTYWQGGQYFTLFKTDSYGDLQWSKRFVQPGNCNVSNIVQLPDSSYFFCFVELNFPEKYYITHLDKYGVLIYCRSLTPPPNYIVAFDPYCIAKPDGNVYVQADLHDLTNGMFGWHLFEVDINGNIVFSTCYNGSILKCLGRSFTQCANGDLLLVGYQRDSVSMEYGPVITRVDSNGILLWSKLYLDTTTSIAGLSISEAGNGNIYATATHTVPGNEVIRLETDANGNLLRAREYGRASAGMSPYTSLLAENNSLLIYGTTDTGSFVLKLDSIGEIMSASRFDWVVPGKIQLHNNSSYSFSGVLSPSNHAVIFTSDTTLQSCFGSPISVDTGTINFQVSSIPNSYQVALFDTVFTLMDTLWPGVDLKICDWAGVEETQTNYALYVFPNPANSSLSIQSEHPFEQFELLDIAGRRIIVNTVRSNQVLLNISNVPAGCYLVRVYFENHVESRRLVIE
jgi:hypothetical protein